MTVTVADIQSNFSKYLQVVQSGDEIIILNNGEEAARLVSVNKTASPLTDSLLGVLKGDYDDKALYDERIRKREGFD